MPVTDNTVLLILAVLAIVIIAGALLLKRISRARIEEERARIQRLAYQPAAKPIPITPPVPVPGPARRPQPPVTAPGPDTTLESCRDFPESLRALTGKYSLDSFTIATSDGLVLGTSGGSTAQEDAALYNRESNGNKPPCMTLISLNHKGSELTGILRAPEHIPRETKERIERDIQGILTKWI